MVTENLLFGRIQNSTLHSFGTNSFIRVRFDCSDGATSLTNVTAVSGFKGIELIRVGMTLTASGTFPSGTTITSVDTANNTLTVSIASSANGTQSLGRVAPPKGMYFIESGSLVVPSNQSLNNRDVTGSQETIYNNVYNRWGIISQLASTGSSTTAIAGDFAQYEITEVTHRDSSTDLSFFITSSKGVLTEPVAKQPVSDSTTFALVELGFSSSVATTFNTSDIGIAAGYGPAAYQIAAGRLIDRLTSGSGGGGGDSTPAFPFTGSAGILGSLSIDSTDGSTDDLFLIKGNTSASGSITVNNQGIMRMQWSGSTPPDAVEGGLYYSASAFYAGLE